MDPLSQATAWAATKITSAAIDLATGELKKGAQSVWEQYFVAAQDQFRNMQVAIEKKMDESVEKTVQKVAENQYFVEMTKIVTAFQTWTSLWADALEDAKKGDHSALKSLREQLRHSETGAANRLSLLDNYLMGTGSVGSGSGGFIKVLEEGLFQRLKDDDFFTIQLYYDSILVLMSRLLRIQLVGFYFRLCTMDEPNEDRANKWVQELTERLKAQKEKMLECMPLLVRKLKSDFDTTPIPAEHWWRFINEGDRSHCLALVAARPWYYAAGLTHGVGDIYALCKGDGTHPCPQHEWRFERPLLVDREPSPKTSAEKHPTADRDGDKQELENRTKDHELDLTFLLSRHSHKRLRLGTELKANGDRYWNAEVARGWVSEYVWNEGLVRFKVLPTKGKPLPTFRLLGIMPERAKTWKGLDAFAFNPMPDTEWFLQDEGTSQNDF